MVPNATLDIRIISVLCVDAVAVVVAVAVAVADSEVAGEADVDEDGSVTVEAFSLVGGVVGDSIWVVAEEGWRATLCIAIACVSSIGRGHWNVDVMSLREPPSAADSLPDGRRHQIYEREHGGGSLLSTRELVPVGALCAAHHWKEDGGGALVLIPSMWARVAH